MASENQTILSSAGLAGVDHLLEQADAFHRAGRIRAYVSTVEKANKAVPSPMTDEELASWKEWAMAQADHIDPVVSGAFRTYSAESSESGTVP